MESRAAQSDLSQVADKLLVNVRNLQNAVTLASEEELSAVLARIKQILVKIAQWSSIDADFSISDSQSPVWIHSVAIEAISGALEDADRVLQASSSSVESTPEHKAFVSTTYEATRPSLPVPDNSYNLFVSVLKEKPHGKFEWNPPSHQEVKPVAFLPSFDQLESFPHPYELEIQALDCPAYIYEEVTVNPFVELDEHELIWVKTEQELRSLCKILDEQKDFAVDLEAHQEHSYQGFVCLMQISTRSQDFIVDPFCVWEYMHLLNSSFTNPNIIKVLHGADWDINWLQRDFGIYVVNLLDTGLAAKLLKFQSKGLKYLLQHFCKVETDKKYQLADWRLRPLTEDMIKYARMDTHYLLYVFDQLRNLISQQRLTSEWFQESNKLCLQRYEKTILSTSQCYDLAARMSKAKLTPIQRQVFLCLYIWRDIVARSLDESASYEFRFFQF
jgi:exosome complex exonuclease RRP6